VEREASALREYGARGDRVAIVGDNSVGYVVALYAVPGAERLLTLVNQRLHPAEQARLCNRVDASAVLGDPERLDVLRAADPARADRCWLPFGAPRSAPARQHPGTGTGGPADDGDAAWLIHTSGTTGPPKAVPLTHANLRAAVDAGARGRPVADDDIYLFPFPLCHVAAYNVLLQHHHGATVVLRDGFDAGDTLAAVERHRVTTMSLAPTMIVRLLEHPALASTDLSSLRSIGYGAAPLPSRVRARAEDLLGCDVVEGYGMTELAGNAAFDGIPDEAVDLRVIDEAGADAPVGTPGEIVARGPQVMGGYWRDAAATSAAFTDGRFRTGDIGRFDEAGRLSVVDRRKDIIITGGENVASREVEETLASHPSVAEVAVVGIADPEWGERITAFIVAAPGSAAGELEASVVAHCRDRIAAFKAPRHIEIVKALPLNAGGKVDKVALRRSLGPQRAQDG
jgi:acyl-CoA synthetase (AMP-forming)/AMP-acid ligase II